MAKTDEGFAMRYMIGKTSGWGKDAFSFKKANKIKQNGGGKSTRTVSNPGRPPAFLKGWSSKSLKSVHT